MIELERWYLDNCTVGKLNVEGFKCFTLELPWLYNKENVSCIPPGVYEYFERHSPTNGVVLELRDVEDRTYIQIHSANFTSQLKGCIAVGDSLKWLDDDDAMDVTNSKNTLTKLLSVAGKKGFITIK